MENKKRIFSAFCHESPDRTPFFEYCLNSKQITHAILGRPCSYLHWEQCCQENGWEKAVRQTVIDRLDICEFFGHDMLYITPNLLPSANHIEETKKEKITLSDDPTENVAIRNAELQASAEELDERFFLVYKMCKEEMGLRKIQLPILAPAYLHGIWTDTDLMQTMLLAPEIAHEHFRLATENAKRFICKYIELEIEIIGIGGDFAGNSPLISPASYKTYIVPELKKLSDIIHCGGAYAVNASDGNLWSVIDDFLIASCVDGYLEIDQHAGMDLKKLKDGYGDKITFIGNMDCGNILSFDSPEKVSSATVECIESGLGNGGHIFTASNAIIDSVPIQNYFAMVNAYRQFWSLTKLECP